MQHRFTLKLQILKQFDRDTHAQKIIGCATSLNYLHALLSKLEFFFTIK